MPKDTSHKHKRNGSASAARNAPYSADGGAAGKKNNIFKMNTDLGQHVLKNPGVAQAIVDKADLKQSDVVLEVGPGTGNLTALILPLAKAVHAVELDPRMAAELDKRFRPTPTLYNKLSVLLGDVIRLPLPRHTVCISNTPYQISSPLVFKLLREASPPPRVAVLMFQREFALRLTARPGDALFCRLSASVQLWAKVVHVMKVGRNNFRPPPQVESSVVRLEPIWPRPEVSWEEWDGLLRVCFVRRNGTLRKAFLGNKGVMAMLEANWRVWCVENGGDLEGSEWEGGKMDLDADGGVEEEEEWNGIEDEEGMDVDLSPPPLDLPAATMTTVKESRNPRSKVAALVRAKVTKVLVRDTQLADGRASKCEQNDFLRLLWAFNKEGIHFA